ncbi:MAG: FadR family transcriptional regulator [Desulfovibrionaceae bacterium]|nr:FadR family transcriptional regulator [Desulfovibrionaceae bacterium]
MEVQRVGKKTISEEIAAQIRGMIDGGQLSPGDRLPAERVMAEMFGVSRTTVREGIKSLAEAGVLESRQGAGTFVRSVGERSSRHAASIIDVILAGDYRLADVFEVRKMLEPEIAAIASAKAKPDDITRLEAILHRQEDAVRKGRSGADSDLLFHQMLADIAGNEVLRELVTALHDALAKSRADSVQSPERQKVSLAAHRAIVAALRSGRGMQAERAMREHLDEVEKIIFGNQK